MKGLEQTIIGWRERNHRKKSANKKRMPKKQPVTNSKS